MIGLGIVLIVGLGNPGARYENQRHNIGFKAIDQIKHDYGFPDFQAKGKALISEKKIKEHRVILLKPQTYMNLSGSAVSAVANFYKIPLSQVIVFHDELDVAPGKIKAKCGGGHGGHNGLRSIDASLGKDYIRVRLGIGHPGDKDKVSSYVLGDFTRKDQDWLPFVLRACSDHLPALIEAVDIPRFLNDVSRDLQ